MNSKTTANSSYDFKHVHLCGVVWFLICVIFTIVIAIDQMGLHWWVVFSVSGYSTVVILFLTMVYLFAIYKGVVRNSNSIEHPLTTSPYYILLYDATPFLGALVGFYIASSGLPVLSLLSVVAQGTLIMTFVMWVITDSLIGIIEASFPQSIAHRKKRIEENQEKRYADMRERQQLLEQIRLQEQQIQSQWESFFEPYVLEIVNLHCNQSVNTETVQIQKRIVELGAIAWQKGGILCMKFFHKLILDRLKSRIGRPSIDFVALCWDGIGTWRKPTEISQMYIYNKNALE